MKRNLLKNITIAGVIAILLAGCEKDVPKYDHEYDMLAFYIRNHALDSILNYTFYFEEENIVYDTVWCKVRTVGFLSDQDRPLKIKQIASHLKDAVSGVHYVPFDDPGLQKFYIIPKNEVENEIPIVLKRDASLKEESFRLHITFEDNEYFKNEYGSGLHASYVRRIDMTDKLYKPANWNSMADRYFGVYGLEKHQFMIDNSPYKWDDEFLVEELNIDVFAKVDQNFLTHLSIEFAEKLEKYNEERKQRGLGVLKENDGTTVIFPGY